MIHHDGPYDAVQPHRNRKKDVRAPMEAFPVGSANNSLGGSGPLNSKIDLDRIHGRGAEGFTDFGSTDAEWKKPRVEAEFSAKGRADIIHGEQSHGLGTSTFLEGAPASRKAVQQDMEAQKAMAESGLGRKKSIAQRFRGISQPRRAYGDGGRITSPEARYGNATSPNGPYSAGAISQTKATETNPFFDEYNQAYDSKGASIKASETNNKDGQSPPGRDTLQRTVTAESLGSPTNEPKPSGGFLNRVKSLKGGRRRPAWVPYANGLPPTSYRILLFTTSYQKAKTGAAARGIRSIDTGVSTRYISFFIVAPGVTHYWGTQVRLPGYYFLPCITGDMDFQKGKRDSFFITF
jgi:hypothetical protein